MRRVESTPGAEYSATGVSMKAQTECVHFDGAILPRWKFLFLMYQNCGLFFMFLMNLSYLLFQRIPAKINYHYYSPPSRYTICEILHLRHTPPPIYTITTIHYLHTTLSSLYDISTIHHLHNTPPPVYTTDSMCWMQWYYLLLYYSLRIVFTQDWNLVNYMFIPIDHI